MNSISTIITALSSLNSNRLRAGLALLGIVIGVTAVIALMSIGRGAQKQVTSQIESLGTNLLFVNPGATTVGGVAGLAGSATTLTLDDAFALVDPLFAPSVIATAPEIRTVGQVVAGRKNTRTQVVGVTPDYAPVRGMSIDSGAFIQPQHISNYSEVTVLGATVSETLFGNRDPVGEFVRINGRQFVVVGVLEKMGGSAQGSFDNQIVVPITTAYYRLSSQRTTEGSISVQLINVQVKSAGLMEQAVTEVATVLRLRHRITGEDDFTISSQQETIEALNETTSTFVVFLGAIAGISLLVGGIGIMNIMLVSVTERTREIGIRKAIGAKRRDILLQFVLEATLLSLGGGLAGVALGLAASNFIDGKSFGTQSFTTAFSGDIALLALVVSSGIGLFFGIYPAMRAARLHPIQALRYE
ncbi:MAG: FtsX-like permease family protein [SAR202 cluster bacterium]|nr:FtsX-like permease family protein [SAR202 cluster bacterium]